MYINIYRRIQKRGFKRGSENPAKPQPVAQPFASPRFLGLKDSPAGYQAALLVPSLWMFGLVVITAMLFEWLWWSPGSERMIDWKNHD